MLRLIGCFGDGLFFVGVGCFQDVCCFIVCFWDFLVGIGLCFVLDLFLVGMGSLNVVEGVNDLLRWVNFLYLYFGDFNFGLVGIQCGLYQCFYIILNVYLVLGQDCVNIGFVDYFVYGVFGYCFYGVFWVLNVEQVVGDVFVGVFDMLLNFEVDVNDVFVVCQY